MGTRVRRGGVTVIEAPGKSSMPEVGVVAGRRVGNAVQRNRTKRRLREAANRVAMRPHRAYVLVASREAAGIAFEDLVEWLTDATAGTSEATSPAEDNGPAEDRP